MFNFPINFAYLHLMTVLCLTVISTRTIPEGVKYRDKIWYHKCSPKNSSMVFLIFLIPAHSVPRVRRSWVAHLRSYTLTYSSFKNTGYWILLTQYIMHTHIRNTIIYYPVRFKIHIKCSMTLLILTRLRFSEHHENKWKYTLQYYHEELKVKKTILSLPLSFHFKSVGSTVTDSLNAIFCSCPLYHIILILVKEEID